MGISNNFLRISKSLQLPLQFVQLICAAAALSAVSAEFDYNPDLYNGNNSNNNQSNEVHNINSYNDNVKQPANSYNAPLTALNAFSGNPPPQPQQQQQQQPTASGYKYNSNDYNNNNAIQRQPEQQQQSQRNGYDFNNAATEKQTAGAVPTPAGYDYAPQNYNALSSSSSSSASASDSDSIGTYTKLETSFNSQAHFLSAPTATPVEEYNPPAKYDYSYNVHDDETGDIKSHAETRDGYFVKGSYSVVDPDGFQRTVRYTVDGPSGFNAIVSRVPYAVRAVPAIALNAPASSAAPVTKVAELPLTSGISLAESSSSAVSVSSASAAEQKPTNTVPIEVPVQPDDSYLTSPVAARDGKGPYP